MMIDKVVVTRDLEEADLPALKALIVEAFGEGWNFGRFAQDTIFFDALLEVYLSMFLNSSTFGRVAEMGGEVVGAILCSASGETEKFRQLQKDRPLHTLALLSGAEPERADVVEHLSVSFQTIGGLLGDKAAAYDGSLELIAVSQQVQGRKIGKALWDEACAYYSSKGAKLIYLISDSACNVGFYDHNGFYKTGTGEAVYNYGTGQRKSQVFVYEYRF